MVNCQNCGGEILPHEPRHHRNGKVFCDTHCVREHEHGKQQVTTEETQSSDQQEQLTLALA